MTPSTQIKKQCLLCYQSELSLWTSVVHVYLTHCDNTSTIHPTLWKSNSLVSCCVVYFSGNWLARTFRVYHKHTQCTQSSPWQKQILYRQKLCWNFYFLWHYIRYALIHVRLYFDPGFEFLIENYFLLHECMNISLYVTWCDKCSQIIGYVPTNLCSATNSLICFGYNNAVSLFQELMSLKRGTI